MADRVAKPRSVIGPLGPVLDRCNALLAENDRERVLDTSCLPATVSNTSAAVQTWADVHRDKPTRTP